MEIARRSKAVAPAGRVKAAWLEAVAPEGLRAKRTHSAPFRTLRPILAHLNCLLEFPFCKGPSFLVARQLIQPKVCLARTSGMEIASFINVLDSAEKRPSPGRTPARARIGAGLLSLAGYSAVDPCS